MTTETINETDEICKATLENGERKVIVILLFLWEMYSVATFMGNVKDARIFFAVVEDVGRLYMVIVVAIWRMTPAVSENYCKGQACLH